MNRSFTIKTQNLVLTGIFLLLLSLPTSKFVMTVSQLWIVFFWMLDGAVLSIPQNQSTLEKLIKRPFIYVGAVLQNFGRKLILFSKNKSALLLSSIFVLHLIGLFASEDMDYALKDIRIKLPIFYLPMVFSTIGTIKNKQFHWLFGLYIATLFTSTIVGIFQYQSVENIDGKTLSPFINHVRFSLNVLMGVFIIAHYLLNIKLKSGFRFALTLLLVWFIIYLFWMESATGIVISIAGLFFIVFRYIRTSKSVLFKVAVIVVALGIPTVMIWQFFSFVDELTIPERVNLNELDKYTSLGNEYEHDTISYGIEEGRYIGLYFCREELESSWNARSEIDYMGKDKKNQYVRHTLIRYLNSLNLRKDADGVAQLSDEDVKNIELGFANKIYVNPYSLKRRFHRIAYGYVKYMKYGDANRSSITQRFEYWKTSLAIIKDKPWFGTGTGDNRIAFKRKYEETNSCLEEEFRRRSHNQFLAITISFGIVGLLWFVFAFFIGAYLNGAYKHFLFNMFMIISVGSMLWEDSLETQAGVTFTIFLYCLLSFSYKPKSFIQNDVSEK